MDNQRPELDLKHFKDICPDENGKPLLTFPMIFTHEFPVPVIVVFTKYDQFLRNVKWHLEDYGNPDDDITDAAERQFREHYLSHLGDGVRFVQLQSMFSTKYDSCVLIILFRNT